MKKKRWKIWHIIAVIAAAVLAVAGAAGAFGQSTSASTDTTGKAPAAITQHADPALEQEEPGDSQQSRKIMIISPTGERGMVDEDLVLDPRAQVIGFRDAYERTYNEIAQERLQHGYLGSENGLLTYVWIVHILAVLGVISIFVWIF